MNRIHISAAALALIAAFAFAGHSKGDQKVSIVAPALQDTTFTTLPESQGGPPGSPQSGTRAEIEPLCPGFNQTCAVATSPDDENNIIEWGGTPDKF